MSYHNRVMNVPADPVKADEFLAGSMAYKHGHRDARHAAAAIAAEADAEVAAKDATIGGLRKLLAKHQWAGDDGDGAVCPECRGVPRTGHSPACRIAAAMWRTAGGGGEAGEGEQRA